MKRINISPKTHLFPLPVVMISCGTLKKPNIITIAYIGTVCSAPPTIVFGIRKNRFSYNLIQKNNDFVINIPDRDLLEKTDLNGIISGKDYDKFKVSELTAIPSTKVKSPSIQETMVNLECVVKNEIELGSHNAIFGEIVNVSIREDLYNEEGIDKEKMKPFCYVKGEYWNLSKKMDTFGFSKLPFADKL